MGSYCGSQEKMQTVEFLFLRKINSLHLCQLQKWSHMHNTNAAIVDLVYISFIPGYNI